MGKINNEKVLFTKRFLAFIIDMLLVGLIASLLSNPFIDNEKNDQLSNELNTLITSYESEEKFVEFLVQYVDIYYEISKTQGVVSFFTIILSVLYFVVYQLYNDGQTIGKKLLKIKVKSEEGDLTMNQMIFRSLLANVILFNIIRFVFLTFYTKDTFYYLSMSVYLIEFIILFISTMMVMFSKSGNSLHDIITHTKVINVN